jgi:hypothetical protein
VVQLSGEQLLPEYRLLEEQNDIKSVLQIANPLTKRAVKKLGRGQKSQRQQIVIGSVLADGLERLCRCAAKHDGEINRSGIETTSGLIGERPWYLVD